MMPFTGTVNHPIENERLDLNNLDTTQQGNGDNSYVNNLEGNQRLFIFKLHAIPKILMRNSLRLIKYISSIFMIGICRFLNNWLRYFNNALIKKTLCHKDRINCLVVVNGESVLLNCPRNYMNYCTQNVRDELCRFLMRQHEEGDFVVNGRIKINIISRDDYINIVRHVQGYIAAIAQQDEHDYFGMSKPLHIALFHSQFIHFNLDQEFVLHSNHLFMYHLLPTFLFNFIYRQANEVNISTLRPETHQRFDGEITEATIVNPRINSENLGDFMYNSTLILSQLQNNGEQLFMEDGLPLIVDPDNPIPIYHGDQDTEENRQRGARFYHLLTDDRIQQETRVESLEDLDAKIKNAKLTENYDIILLNKYRDEYMENSPDMEKPKRELTEELKAIKDELFTGKMMLKLTLEDKVEILKDTGLTIEDKLCILDDHELSLEEEIAALARIMHT